MINNIKRSELDLNQRIRDLQSLALPLGYRTIIRRQLESNQLNLSVAYGLANRALTVRACLQKSRLIAGASF